MESEKELISSPSSKAWSIIRNYEGFGYHLKLADTFRFGRVRFKVIRLYGVKDTSDLREAQAVADAKL